MGGKDSKVVVLQWRLLETLGEVQGVEERGGSGNGSASVRKGGSKSRVGGNGQLKRGFTFPLWTGQKLVPDGTISMAFRVLEAP